MRQANDLAKNTHTNVYKIAQKYPDGHPYEVYSSSIPRDGPTDRYKKDDFEVEVHSTPKSNHGHSRANIAKRAESQLSSANIRGDNSRSPHRHVHGSASRLSTKK